jgi:hypothetical protein
MRETLTMWSRSVVLACRERRGEVKGARPPAATQVGNSLRKRRRRRGRERGAERPWRGTSGGVVVVLSVVPGPVRLHRVAP